MKFVSYVSMELSLEMFSPELIMNECCKPIRHHEIEVVVGLVNNNLMFTLYLNSHQ